MDSITLAYSSLDLQCPIGVRAHSTRGIASSWAWSSGVSISEICVATGLASPSTFVRFYQPGFPCLAGQSPFCLNKLSYGFTWPTLLKPLLHLFYSYYTDARYQLTGRHLGHGWPYGPYDWLPCVLLPRESWCWVVPRHSTTWLYLFPFKRLRRSTSEILKGNVLGYYSNRVRLSS